MWLNVRSLFTALHAEASRGPAVHIYIGDISSLSIAGSTFMGHKNLILGKFAS